jgi:PAS domain-containing protein
MTPEPAARRAESLRLFSAIAGTAVMIEGGLVLVGWALDIPALESVFTGLGTLKPNTAVAGVLMGFSLWRLRGGGGRGARRAADSCAVLAALVGLLTLLEYLLGLDFSIDGLLIRASLLIELGARPVRMAPPTAASLLLLGLAMLLSRRQEARSGRIADVFAVTVALVSAVALTGYVYGVESLYKVGGRSPMSLPTAVTLILLSAGLIASQPERGLLSIAITNGPGGRAARRLLPVAVALPFVLGWLGVLGQRADLYDAAFGVSVRALAVIAIFSAVILWNARSLDQLDGERRMAEEQTREKGRVLQLILDSMTDGVAVADAQGQFLVFNRAAEEILGWAPGTCRPTHGRNASGSSATMERHAIRLRSFRSRAPFAVRT